MSATNRVRLQRILREVEGYLELGLARRALETLERIENPGTFKGKQLFLKGEALRSLQRYADALEPLERAADLMPSNVEVYVALGWCYKRTGRLDLAIKALERAQEAEPEEPLIHYNLACYWSLAGEKQRALEYLSQAFTMRPALKDLVGSESDFDSLRSDPDFLALTGQLA